MYGVASEVKVLRSRGRGRVRKGTNLLEEQPVGERILVPLTKLD